MTGRGPQRLTDAQQKALDQVTQSDNELRAAKKVIAARIRREAERELAAYEKVRDDAVYAAVLAGVPKTRIAQEGMGTKNLSKIYEVISEYEHEAAEGMPVVTAEPSERWSWNAVDHLPNGITIAWLWDNERTDQLQQEIGGVTGHGWAYIHSKATDWFLPPQQRELPIEGRQWAEHNWPVL